MYLEITLLILSVALLAMILMIIPLVIYISRFLKGLTVALENINQDLPKILRNMDELAVNLRTTSFLFKRRVEAIDTAMSKIQTVLGILMGVEDGVRAIFTLPAFRFMRTANALVKGVRVFTKVLRGEQAKTPGQ